MATVETDGFENFERLPWADNYDFAAELVTAPGTSELPLDTSYDHGDPILLIDTTKQTSESAPKKRRSRISSDDRDFDKESREREVNEELATVRNAANARLKSILNLDTIKDESKPNSDTSTEDNLKKELDKAITELPETSSPFIVELLQIYGFSIEETDKMTPQELHEELLSKMAFDHFVVAMLSSTGNESKFAERNYPGVFKSLADLEKYEYFGLEIGGVFRVLEDKIYDTHPAEEYDEEGKKFFGYDPDDPSELIDDYNELFPEDPIIVVSGLIAFNEKGSPQFYPSSRFSDKYGGGDPCVMVFHLKDSAEGHESDKKVKV